MDDVWAGRVSVSHVLTLAEHLQLNPQSRCRMIRLGGDTRWIGWDSTSELQAATHDLIWAFAAGEQFTEANRYPRPGSRDVADEPNEPQLFAPTIADFNCGAFMKVIQA